MDDLIPFFHALPPELATIILGALPVTELRASLPIAQTVFHLSPGSAYFFSVLGNLIPLFVVFPFLPRVIRLAERHFPGLKKFLDTYFHQLTQKHHEKFRRYGTIALLVFVAIPAPGSGAWTGSILAVLFDLDRRYSIPAIVGGILCAGVIVLLITQGTLEILSFLL